MKNKISPEKWQAYAKLRKEFRENCIQKLLESLKGKKHRNDSENHFLCQLYFDTKLSPITTNLKMLEDIGYHFNTSKEFIKSLNEETAIQLIFELAEGLKLYNIYLQSTNHISSVDLYELMVTKILVEKVRENFADSVEEFIDLSKHPPSNETEVCWVLSISNRDSFIGKLADENTIKVVLDSVN